jgi:hypothetical protein
MIWNRVLLMFPDVLPRRPDADLGGSFARPDSAAAG